MEQVYSPPKKMKRKSLYKDEWEARFGICEIDGNKLICVICGLVLTCFKRSNLKKHYSRVHSNFEKRFPFMAAYEARCAEISYLKFLRFNAPFAINQSIVVKKSSVHFDLKTATQIGFTITYYLMKNGKPFNKIETYRDIASVIFKCMFEKTENEQLYINFFEKIPLSRKTIVRRSRDLVDDVMQQLYNDLNNCKFFSIQLGGSMDMTGTFEIILFVRMTFDNLCIREELLSLMSLNEKDLDQDIYSQFKNELEKKSLPFHKLISITKNGSTNITNVLVRLLKEQTPLLNNIHEFNCIMNQQASCVKTLSIPEVEFVVISTVNLIRPHLASFQQHKNFSNPKNAEFRVLKYYDNKNLNREETLEHFYENIVIIDKFLSLTGQSVSELRMFSFIVKLAFLVDMNMIFKEFNLQMQVKNIFIWEYINILDHAKSFLSTAASCFKLCEIHRKFFRLNQIANEYYGNGIIQLLILFADYIENLISTLNDSFKDFEIVRILCNYFSTLFNVPADPIEKEGRKIFIRNVIIKFDPKIDIHGLEMELNNLPMDYRLKGMFLVGGNIWPIIAVENTYPRLLSVYQKLSCCFGSTYLCNLKLAHLRYAKCTNRSTLNDDDLHNRLKLFTTSYSPNIEKLSAKTKYYPYH